MRTIKFRGKRIDNAEWVYGYYAYNTDLEGHYILNGGGSINEVYPKTVEQFTCRIDKNGTEIYEGDILKGFRSRHSRKEKNIPKNDIVVWAKNGWKRESYNGQFKTTPDIDYKEMEVIGNIHENKNLLE